MIRLWFGLLLFLSSAALGAPVVVKSGEHDGFTRLVLDFGDTADWKLGRSTDGYLLEVTPNDRVYDLRQVFAPIGKTRLASIWVDPATSALNLGLACACHAIPFEFRPGILVIDLKDGPPPKGSSFELAPDGELAIPLDARTPPRPRQRPGPPEVPDGYRWTDLVLSGRSPRDLPGATGKEGPIATGSLPQDLALQPLRDNLLTQMARGAAQGVVDMQRPEGLELHVTEYPQTQIRIGESSGQTPGPDDNQHGDLTAAGAECVPAEALDLSGWGDDTRPVTDQLAELKRDMTGEFDLPEPNAVNRAIMFHLYLGFGAEARQMIRIFNVDEERAAIWESLAYLLDEASDPTHRFRGQAACDGPAALWAMLEDPPVLRGDPMNTRAVRLAFSALPIHLRQHIGPRLSDRFSSLGDAETAHALIAAVGRSPVADIAGIGLMTAEIALSEGDGKAAEEVLVEVLADPGSDRVAALVALVEARAAQRMPIAPEVAQALMAYEAENAGTAISARLKRASIIAQAGAGMFEAAFAALPDVSTAERDVWALTAALAPDADFLTVAVLDPDAPVTDLDDSLSTDIARRLLGLGLASPAKRWISGVREPDPLLLAQIELALRDGSNVISVLADQTGPEVEALRVQAFDILGQETLRAERLATQEDPGAASAALARANDWTALADHGAELWKPIATHVVQVSDTALSGRNGPNPDAKGPLAAGHDLAAAGAQTRAQVEALLAALPAPEMAIP